MSRSPWIGAWRWHDGVNKPILPCSNCGYDPEAHLRATGQCLFEPQSTWWHPEVSWRRLLWKVDKERAKNPTIIEIK